MIFSFNESVLSVFYVYVYMSESNNLEKKPEAPLICPYLMFSVNMVGVL